MDQAAPRTQEPPRSLNLHSQRGHRGHHPSHWRTTPPPGPTTGHRLRAGVLRLEGGEHKQRTNKAKTKAIAAWEHHNHKRVARSVGQPAKNSSQTTNRPKRGGTQLVSLSVPRQVDAPRHHKNARSLPRLRGNVPKRTMKPWEPLQERAGAPFFSGVCRVDRCGVLFFRGLSSTNKATKKGTTRGYERTRGRDVRGRGRRELHKRPGERLSSRAPHRCRGSRCSWSRSRQSTSRRC
jgi:hypothetical protein